MLARRVEPRSVDVTQGDNLGVTALRQVPNMIHSHPARTDHAEADAFRGRRLRNNRSSGKGE